MIPQIFSHEVFGEIRILDKHGEPWFVAKDVAKTLGYANKAQAIRLHCKGVLETSTPSNGGLQVMKIIPESDVYRLVMRSKLPSAESFQDWVVSEVLPQIRKTGKYETTETYAELSARALTMANEIIADQRAKIEQDRQVVHSCQMVVEINPPSTTIFCPVTKLDAF